ncbi:MAG: hypothetical protein AAFO07_04710 [Bacteroidota bacterium]
MSALLTLEVSDKRDEISYASGYAKHPLEVFYVLVSSLLVPPNYQ